MARYRTTGWAALALAMVGAPVSVMVGPGPTATSAGAAPAGPDLPPGFTDEVVWEHRTAPTAVRFAPDGRVFVAELTGTIEVYDSVDDPTPEVSGDEPWTDRSTPPPLEVKVHAYADRGLMDIALDPDFPAEPWIYLSYVYNHAPGTGSGAVPAHEDPYQHAWDPCEGPDGDAFCPAEGRISRMRVQPDGSIDTTREQVLVGSGHCFVYASHTMGALDFDGDGYLYGSAGDGASFLEADTGGGDNPCPDAADEGGSLRAQDLAHGDDPVGLNGAIIRIDPDTGAGAPGNPLAGSSDPNARRIIAHGMRNPFRFDVRGGGPGGKAEVFVGDVGNSDYEEVDRVPVGGAVENFGWPCYEGPDRHPEFAGQPACQQLYADADGHTPPWWGYEHWRTVLPDGSDRCGVQQPGDNPTSGSVSSVGFLGATTPYPDRYDGALVIGDYTRQCLWVMPRGPGGDPDPARIEEFTPAAGNVVMAQPGLDGELWTVEIFTPSQEGGRIHRFTYDPGNRRPVAALSARPTSGSAPLTVQFDGRGSTDPDGDPLTYAWDLDGDGAFDDATGPTASWTYEDPGLVTAGLRVSDPEGLSDSDDVQIQAGNDPPQMVIDRPGDMTVVIGDRVEFAGHATDPQDGALPAAAIDWQASIRHCPAESSCHTHPLQTWPDTDAGSFVVPHHDLPAHILLTATATDSRGLTATDTVRLDVAAPDAPPAVTITEPATGTTYAVGERVRFAATATDPETGALPAERVDWRLEAVSCEAGACTADTVREWTGRLEGSFRPGQQPQDVSLRLVATAADPGGQVASDSVDLAPRRSRLVFVSRPGRARLAVAGETARRRLVGDYVVGSRIEVRADSRIRVHGRVLRFRRWSHTRSRRHTLVVPAQDRRYVARYRR